jgi:trans-aconitate methyltransferase
MEREYGDVYATLYRRHWWWRAREAMIMRELRRLAPAEGFGQILDVGCGDALFFGRLAELGEPWGVESDAHLVTEATRALGRVHVGPFDASYAPAGRFGLVTMLDVIEHVEHDTAFLRRGLELLTADGALVVTVPAMPLLWTHHDDVNQHFRRYTRRSFRDLVASAGGKLASLRYAFRWIVPAKLMQRGWETVRGGRHHPVSVPPTPINRTLELVTRAEDALLRRLPLPFGSSLFAVIRR